MVDIEKVIKVSNVQEVLELLEKYKENAQILAGGTDLIVQIREGKNTGSIIIDISDIREMKKIKISDGQIIIGSLVTFTDLHENEYIRNNYLGLWKAAKSIGSPQIRNRGTIGGNICNGSPAADIVPPLLVLDAQITLVNKKGNRVVKLSDFYESNKKPAINPNEILYTISFKKLDDKEKEFYNFEKLGLRNALAISRISSSVYFKIDHFGKIKEMRIASGALGLYPIREYKVENFMKGKILDKSLIEEGANLISKEVAKRLNGRSSLEYKKEAVKGIFKKAVGGYR